MKDTQGNPITEEEFMKDIGHGVVKQDWKEQIRGVSIKSDTTSTGLEVKFEPEVLIKPIESLLSEQSFIKYLKNECERLEKSKHKIYDNWATTHDRDDERFTKLTKEEKSYNQAISDQITHLQAQIKELEV